MFILRYFSGDNVSVRLRGGSGSHEGRIEITRGNTVGTVCDDAFGESDAKVVCRMLGYRFVMEN